jgi:hypothetical protein
MTSFIMNGAVVGYGRLPSPARVFQFDADAVIFWDGNEQPEFGPPYNDGASFPREIVPARDRARAPRQVGDLPPIGRFEPSVHRDRVL